MKRFLTSFLLIFIILSSFCFVACVESTPLQPDDSFVTYSFDLGELSQTTMEPITVQVGKIAGDFPIPEDMEPIDGYYGAWYIDEEKTTLYDSTATVTEPLTLYLGYAPRQYSVTFVYDENLSFSGEFPTYYIHGEQTSLPQINLGEGYQEEIRWVYGTGEREYYTYAIPESAVGDLVLTLSAQPIQYKIFYNTGLSDVDFSENANPSNYNITMGNYSLINPSVEGKVFKYWVLKSTNGKDPLNNTIITELNMDIFRERLVVTLFAVWE